MYYIYVIENLIDGKMYVGQTCDPKERERRHLNGYETGCVALHNAISKYGKANFEFILLEGGLSLEESNEREIYWIHTLNTMRPQGYNLRYGGEAGGIPGFEARERMRLAQLGKKQSKEQIEKRAASHRGRKNTPETIERMRTAARNKSPEKCSMFGKKRPKEWIEKCREWMTKTHCKRGHPLEGKGSDVYIDKNGKRDCRACKRERRREASWKISSS